MTAGAVDRVIGHYAIPSLEALARQRMHAMRTFLDDFDAGRAAGRYVDAELPSLPFPDLSFDLALCSHFLFLYTSQLGEAFHHAAIGEMCRVAGEVRVFPLLALGAQPSPLADRCAAALGDLGFEVSRQRVPYEFQRGGNEMMRVRRAGPVTGNAVGERREAG